MARSQVKTGTADAHNAESLAKDAQLMLVMPELGGLSPNLCKGHVQLMLVMLGPSGSTTIKEKKAGTVNAHNARVRPTFKRSESRPKLLQLMLMTLAAEACAARVWKGQARLMRPFDSPIALWAADACDARVSGWVGS